MRVGWGGVWTELLGGHGRLSREHSLLVLSVVVASASLKIRLTYRLDRGLANTGLTLSLLNVRSAAFRYPA